VHAEVMENKVKYEEKVFTEKELNHKLTIQLHGLMERY